MICPMYKKSVALKACRMLQGSQVIWARTLPQKKKTQNQNCRVAKLINDGQEHFAKEKREEIPKGSNSGYECRGCGRDSSAAVEACHKPVVCYFCRVGFSC